MEVVSEREENITKQNTATTHFNRNMAHVPYTVHCTPQSQNSSEPKTVTNKEPKPREEK